VTIGKTSLMTLTMSVPASSLARANLSAFPGWLKAASISVHASVSSSLGLKFHHGDASLTKMV